MHFKAVKKLFLLSLLFNKMCHYKFQEGNKKSLLDLEMADYERSITELNNKIKKKEDEIEDLENEVKMLKEKNDCLHEELSKFFHILFSIETIFPELN